MNKKSTSSGANPFGHPSGTIKKQNLPQQLKKQSQIQSSLDPERQKYFEVLQKLKQVITQVKSENQELETNLNEYKEQNVLIQEESKRALTHVETMNMMSKYQLVYIRLETALKKIANNLEARKRLRLKRGFQAFKFGGLTSLKIAKKKHLVCSMFELRLDLMIGTLERYTERVDIGQAFRRMKSYYLSQREINEVKKTSQKKINEINSEITSTLKKIDSLKAKKEELDSETALTKRRISDQQKYQSELEEREVKLNSEYMQLQQKAGASDHTFNVRELEDKVRQLETQVGELENENKAMKGKIQNKSGSLGSFVSEMNSLLDQFELPTNQNMEVESGQDYEEDHEEEENQMMQFDPTNGGPSRRQFIPSSDQSIPAQKPFEEVHPHAGTGGSSKLRSRPTTTNSLHAINSQLIMSQQQPETSAVARTISSGQRRAVVPEQNPQRAIQQQQTSNAARGRVVTTSQQQYNTTRVGGQMLGAPPAGANHR